MKYNAYYPFDKKNFDSADMKTKIPVNYVGQKQNGTSCDIGAFDYTYSDWAIASGGTVRFDFHHIGAIAVFKLPYPATATYTKLTLSVNDSLIPQKGTYDLTAEDVSFVADDDSYSSSISLDLVNCNGVARDTGIFYMMLPPMNLSSSEVTLSLTTSTGTTCTYTINKVLSTINKGKLYRRTGIIESSNVEGSTDDWEEEEDNDGIPNNQIWYTSSDGNKVTLCRPFGEISSHVYENGKGIITFNEELTTIGAYAFSECFSLTSITIPSCVTSIGEYAFYNCI